VTEISVEIQKKKILFYRISGYFGEYLIFAFFARMLNARKKKLRTAIEWDYGILPPSSIKGLPTDKNV
jgi:hypothetical protein